MRTLFAPRRSSVLSAFAVAFTLFVGCSEGETFFPPLGSSGAGAGGGAGTGGASGGSTPAGAGNVPAGSGGIAAGSGGAAATGGLSSAGGAGGASAGGAGSAGTGGSPIAGSPGTGGVSEGGQGNETGDAGEAAGGVGLGGSTGTGGSASGASGSAGAPAGSAGQDAGAGGVAGTAGVGGAGTAGLGGAGASGGSAGNCGSPERCDGTDNDCDGDSDEGAVCPVGCGAERYDDHVYLLCDYSDDTDYVDYEQASEWCAAAGAALDLDRVFELSHIESSEENAFVKAWIASTSGVGMIWFGANDLDQERTWVWGRGADAVQFFTGSFQGGGMPYMGRYEDFAAGRPSSANGVDEDCGAFDSEFAWQWNDLACARGRRGFVCEERDP